MRLRAASRTLLLATILTALSCGGGSGGGGGTSGSNSVHGAVVATGFDQPMYYIANPADSTLAYVLERPGRIRVLVNDVLQAAPVLDITSTVRTDGECGLLGIAIDPNFATNHYFYLHYDAGNPIESRIVRYTMNASGLSASGESQVLSFQQTGETNHKGGALNFGQDGYLYLAFGDGGSGNDPNNLAQDPTVFFGKMLRIDPSADDFPGDPAQNYSIPASNPYVGTAGVRGEIWDFGLRNPFRWTVDPTTGGFLIADVGQDAFEEFDYEPAGTGHRNYGWRMREGFHATANGGPAFSTPFTNPFYEIAHPHCESIIGGIVYRGSVLPAAVRGRYFYGDYTTGRIESVPFGLSGGEANLTTLSAALSHTSAVGVSTAGALSGPVSITPDKNGEMMVCDLNTGSLIRLVP